MLAGVLVLTLVGSLLSTTSGSGGDSTDDTAALATDQSILPGSTDPAVSPVTQVSDLPAVAVTELPPQALDTLLLIDDGGPFPYDRDGVTFFNREGLLPAEAEGYYHEYTVPTPGETDRGARRLVVGDGGEVYYTDDHYESFREVVSG